MAIELRERDSEDSSVVDPKTEVRMTVRLSRDAKETLDWLARERGGVSYAEVIRRALGTEQFLLEMKNKNASILIEEPGTKRLKEIILR